MQSAWYFCLIVTKLEFSWLVLTKFSTMKFHKTPAIGSWVSDGWTDMMQRIGSFNNFVNTPDAECCKMNGDKCSTVFWQRGMSVSWRADNYDCCISWHYHNFRMCSTSSYWRFQNHRIYGKGEGVPVLNWAPCHEEFRYSSVPWLLDSEGKWLWYPLNGKLVGPRASLHTSEKKSCMPYCITTATEVHAVKVVVHCPAAALFMWSRFYWCTEVTKRTAFCPHCVFMCWNFILAIYCTLFP